VFNSATGEPLRKTELMLRGGEQGGEFSATSDANGHYAIERVAPGTYSLTAQHQNFAVSTYGATRTGGREGFVSAKRITLTAGQSLTGIDLKLIPFGVVTGRVVDQDGDPIAGVPVTVLRWGFVRGGRQLQPAGGGSSTNDRGEFRIYNLAAGRYYLNARPVRTESFAPPEPASARRPVARVEPSRESYVSTYYPSSSDAATAAPILVSPGQEVQGMDIQLRKSRTSSISGRIAGFDKSHRYGLSLQPHEQASSGNFGGSRAAAMRPDDGSFVFRGVIPGRYTLLAMVDNRMGARQDISVGDGDLDGVVIAMSDAGTVKGRIQVEASAGAKQLTLRRLRVSLTPVDMVPTNIPNASSAEDGSFSMDEVPADRYKVTCSPLDGAYLKTIRWGGQISNDGLVDMTPGGSTVLELVFAPTTAQIEGDVKIGDEPAPGAQVLLIPTSMKESDFRVTIADQSGHFRAKGVAPGSYAALATDATIFTLPDAPLVKALEKMTTSVNVDENGQATVSLKLVPESAIEAAQ
jgi:protocatechuate 3,4-dioxygenase beta subunit